MIHHSNIYKSKVCKPSNPHLFFNIKHTENLEEIIMKEIFSHNCTLQMIRGFISPKDINISKRINHLKHS